MAMALVDSGVGRKKVEILLSFDIPHVDALALVEYDRERMVVMSTILLLQVHELFCGFSCLSCHKVIRFNS
jgi:hypothetical protein